MKKGSIFERLSGEFDAYRFEEGDSFVHQSIANNLSKIFSTNAGSAPTVMDYGKPDLNNSQLSLKDSLDLIEKFSEDCIRKYEPRLINAQVTIVKERLSQSDMTLHIQGGLLIEGKNRQVHYRASLNHTGSVKVYTDEN